MDIWVVVGTLSPVKSKADLCRTDLCRIGSCIAQAICQNVRDSTAEPHSNKGTQQALGLKSATSGQSAALLLLPRTPCEQSLEKQFSKASREGALAEQLNIF